MQLDLKPEELKEYMGSSPCPADIDDFWDGEIAKMKMLDPRLELKKVFDYPYAECFEYILPA